MATRFGNMLHEFRRRAGLSQRALADEAGIDVSYVSRLESGDRQVASRELALALASLLKLRNKELELWLLSAGYASPQMQESAGSRISRLMEEIRDEPRR